MTVPANSRLEIKFVARESETPRLVHWLHTHAAGFRAPYPQRTVNNVYFDTWSYGALDQNLSGASERTKVRFRWYGNMAQLGPGQLEVKCKRNQLGWKLEFAAPEAPQVAGDSWHNVRRRLRAQLPPQGRLWLDANPVAVLINRYSRQYFVSGDGTVRATVDAHQEVYEQRYKPQPNLTRRANLPPTLIVEFKFEPAARRAMTEHLSGIPLRVSRNSKYVNGVNALAC